MTYEDIKRVNENMGTVNIKGKEYAQVPTRVHGFRELYPEGCIKTEIISLDNGVVTMMASIFDDNGKLLATGMAQEKESSSFINKTSFIENCETSAVGRALGFIGIGSEKSIASAEEVETAINNQDNPLEVEKIKREILALGEGDLERINSFVSKCYPDDPDAKLESLSLNKIRNVKLKLVETIQKQADNMPKVQEPIKTMEIKKNEQVG